MKKFLALLFTASRRLHWIARGLRGDGAEAEETDLVIQAYLGGYGVAGIQAVADRFVEINADKGYTVTVTPNANMVYKGVYGRIPHGPQPGTFGYVHGRAELRERPWSTKAIPSSQQDWEGEVALADLSDVYASRKPYGEDTLFSGQDQRLLSGK